MTFVYIRAASRENQRSGFWPGPTQTRLYSYMYIRWLETCFTAKLICVFDFPYSKCWFSNDAAHIQMVAKSICRLIKSPFKTMYYQKGKLKCIFDDVNISVNWKQSF